MDLDATQALDLDEYNEIEEENEAKRDRKQVGQLMVFRTDDLEEKIYDIYEGDNFIGRDESCDVYIPRKSLSKTHACIEVSDNLHMVYDDNSKNRTRRDKMILKPQVRYELRNGDMLTLADTKCQYFKGRIEQDIDDTGSETGSESMLPIGADVKDTSKEEDPFAADTESETDDDKDPVTINKPVVYSSDEKLAKEDVVEDSEQAKPIVPAFMYDSNDDDDDDDDDYVSRGAHQKSSDDVKVHMDVSADIGTLAFGLVSPDDMTIIRPTSKKMPEMPENTPLTLVYSPDTQDRTPDNPSIPPKSKDEGNSCAPTLIYGSESPYKDKSPEKIKGAYEPNVSNKGDSADIDTDDEPGTPEETALKNVAELNQDIGSCSATVPVHETETLKETLIRDTPGIGIGTLDETPLKYMPQVGETPSEFNVYLPETQGFSPGNEETSFCEPTQAYLQESPVDMPKEIPTRMVGNIPDSEGEGEEEDEEKSQSDSDVKKVLSYDDSATQAYTWNDSDATDDEDDELRFQATQPYPSHIRQPAKDEKSKPEANSPKDEDEEDMQKSQSHDVSPAAEETAPCFSSSLLADLQQTVAYDVAEMDTQAYDAEAEDVSSDHAEDRMKHSKDKHMEIEPTVPYDIMEMETQAYDAETEDTAGPNGSQLGNKGKGPLKKFDAKFTSNVRDVKGLTVEATLPYEISETDVQDFDNNKKDGQNATKQTSKMNPEGPEDSTSRKDPAVEQTLACDIQMETQAYDREDLDESETEDEDNQERTVFENKGKRKENQEASMYDVMETQAYGGDVETEDDDVNPACTSNVEDLYEDTQAYGLEKTVTSHTAEVIPDSEDLLSQEIPINQINKDEDTMNNNVPDKKQATFSSDLNEIEESMNQEEVEIIIRPTRRGRGRVTQSSAEEEQQQPVILTKPDTKRTRELSTRSHRKGKSSLPEASAAQDVKVRRANRGKISKKSEVGDASSDDGTIEDGSSSKPVTESSKDLNEQKSLRGRKSKKKEEAEKEDIIPEDTAEEQSSKPATNLDEDSLNEPKPVRGRRRKKKEEAIVENSLPDDTVDTVRNQSSSKPVIHPAEDVQKEKPVRGSRSKKKEDAAENILPDDATEDQSSSKLATIPKEDLRKEKPVRGRKSKKKEDTAENILPDDATEDQSSSKLATIPKEDLRKEKPVRGRKSKKKEDTAENILPDNATEDQSSSKLATIPKEDLRKEKPVRGRRSAKKREETKRDDTLPDVATVEQNKSESPVKVAQEKRSTRGRRTKNIKEDDTAADEVEGDLSKTAETPEKYAKNQSSRGKRSTNGKIETGGGGALPGDSEEEFVSKRKGKREAAVALPVDQDSSGMDDDLPSLDTILSHKKTAKGRGKTTKKTDPVEITPKVISKEDSPTRDTVEDEELCSKPVVVKPFFPRRGRGRVTQSDDSSSAVPGTSGSDMSEFKQEDLMSPQSVARSISKRKGKKTKEEASEVGKETEMDMSESQSSTSSATGSKTRNRGKESKADTVTTELNDSQSSVTLSVGSKTGNRRGKTAKAAELDDTHLQSASQSPDVSESQSSTTSSVENKTRGKGRRRTGRATALDDTQGEEVQETPVKKNRTVKQEAYSPTMVQSPSLRKRKQNAPKIMFTGVNEKQAEKIVTSLGGTLVDSVYECTHLITDKVRRTVKFLCGVASGQMIVQPQWLTACKKAKHFIEPEPFIVNDKAAEKQYSFSLQQSLEKALRGRLLEGYKLHITKNVKPEPNQMKDIISCANGEYLPRMPRIMEENVLVVSCDTDKDLCKPALACGLPVYSAELLLTGVLQQELQLDQHRLFVDESGSEIGTKKRKTESLDGARQAVSSANRSSKRKKK